MTVLDTAQVRRISHHPVHVMAGDGSLSPSAFIPFCEFGADKAVVGERVAEIDVHVCNIFQEVTMAGQICYEVDVNEFKDSVNNTKRALETGLTFWMDYNPEKQVMREDTEQNTTSADNFADRYLEKEKGNNALIYIGTLGGHYIYWNYL